MEISRRSFFKGAGVAVAGAALNGIALNGIAAAEAEEEKQEKAFEETVDWDAEYDVIVCGTGIGGVASAVAAAEAGAKVLMLEKAPKAFAGGNSRFGQNFLAFTDREMAIQYMKNLRGQMKPVQGDDMIELLVDGAMQFHDWLNEHGIDDDHMAFATRPEWPELYPDQSGKNFGFRKITIRQDKRFGAPEMNANQLLYFQIIEKMKDMIDVWWSSPAVSLVQDPVKKTIHGVKCTHDGQEYTVRAKNGVILATGGFENNQTMQQNYLGYVRLYPKGCNFNTGDGVVMAQEVGAQLWHMCNGAFPDPNFIHPYTGCAYGWTCSCDGVIPGTNYGDMGTSTCIFVAGDGTRFMNEASRETFTSRHGQIDFHGTWQHMPYPEVSWMIFDEAARVAGKKPYRSFSDGLTKEIELGWIVKGETLQELGEKIGIEGDAIAKTIEKYNALCTAGEDIDWNRPKECLVPFSGEGPFYAMEMKPCVTNTDGGAKRNAKCEVVDPREKPIPHLYSAGSFGSMFVGAYNGGGNMAEGFATGNMAGKNAAMVKEDAIQSSLLKKEAVNFADTYEHTVYLCGSNQYLGRAWGMNKDMTVRLTVDGSRMVDLEILEHNETPRLSDEAIIEMPKRILEAQSTDVDAVAGATKTCTGIKLATEAAMKLAGLEIKIGDVVVETVK